MLFTMTNFEHLMTNTDALMFSSLDESYCVILQLLFSSTFTKKALENCIIY